MFDQSFSCLYSMLKDGQEMLPMLITLLNFWTLLKTFLPLPSIVKIPDPAEGNNVHGEAVKCYEWQNR